MSLTSHQQLLVCIDAIGPVVFTTGFIFLRYFNRISHSLWLAYLFGIGLCCLWEIPFGIAGDDFLIEKFDNPLGFGVHILHAFWDSIIFLFGMYFIHIRNKNKICGLGQLALLTVYGLLQEFIVEMLFNNNYWYYKTDNRNNPVVFTINDSEYTCVPFLVWLVFPILYLSGVFSIIEKYGPLKLNDRNQINDSRCRNLIEHQDEEWPSADDLTVVTGVTTL
tara:strand:- start:2172 stop:2834 length:663 start_codon:yes stop_codon:yes gene_type:complete